MSLLTMSIMDSYCTQVGREGLIFVGKKNVLFSMTRKCWAMRLCGVECALAGCYREYQYEQFCSHRIKKVHAADGKKWGREFANQVDILLAQANVTGLSRAFSSASGNVVLTRDGFYLPQLLLGVQRLMAQVKPPEKRLTKVRANPLPVAQGNYADAGPLYTRSLGIREKVLGPDHPDVAFSLSGLAALLDSQVINFVCPE